MVTTKVMGLQYDEDRLTLEEQEKLEDFCWYLSTLLNEKLDKMGLHVVQGAYVDYITKFTEDELKNIKKM